MKDTKVLNQSLVFLMFAIVAVVAAIMLEGCTKTSKAYYPNAKYKLTDVEYGALQAFLERERVLLTYGEPSEALLYKPLEIVATTPQKLVGIITERVEIEDILILMKGRVERRDGSNNIEFITDRGNVVAVMIEEGNGFVSYGQELRVVCFDMLVTPGVAVLTRCRTAELALSRMFTAFEGAFEDLFQGKDTDFSAIKPLIPLAIAYGRNLKPGSHCDASTQDYDGVKCWQSINEVSLADGEALAVKAELKALGIKL